MASPQHQPIWDDTSLPRFAPLDRDLSVDVAVVGAGVTGITAASLLKRAGCRVALVDRRSVGGVDTGCTTAHLTAVMDTSLVDLASSFGPDHARAIWDAGLAAIDQIATLAAGCDADCELTWAPGFRHAPFDAEGHSLAGEIDRLTEEAALAWELGFDVTAVPSTPLVDRAGWRIEHQALINPRKYLNGLLVGIPGQGSVVCEHSEVRFSDEADTIECAGHRIRAAHVLVATHNPLSGRQSTAAAALLQTQLALYTTYAVGARVAGAFDDTTAAYWDTSKPYRHIRVDRDEVGVRLIAGGEDHKTGQEPDTRKPYEALARWLGSLIPGATITHRWSGQVISTSDGLPFIGEVAPRQYIATGFAGTGMTFGTLAAMIVRDDITGAVPNPWRELFDVHRSAIARGPIDYLRENADYPYYLARDRFAGAATRSLRAVGPGEGKLVDIDGEAIAASRDERGELTLLSPVCTHMGCRVGWNQAEGTWDCPCHGSRFTARGEVLAGPAAHPLERYRAAAGQAGEPARRELARPRK